MRSAPPLAVLGLLVATGLVLARLLGIPAEDPVVAWTGGSVKILALLAAAVAAGRAAAAFEADDRPRRSFRLLAAGFAAFLLGQALLWRTQLWSSATVVAFPTAADVAFVVATFLLVAAFVDFLGAYVAAGSDLGASRSLGARVTVVAVPLGLLAATLLLVVGRSEATVAARLVNASYVVLDAGLAVIAAAIWLIVRGFSGGLLAGPWAVLGVGILLSALGDGAFAAVSVLHMEAVEPALDLFFMASYVCFAWGTTGLRRIVAG